MNLPYGIVTSSPCLRISDVGGEFREVDLPVIVRDGKKDVSTSDETIYRRCSDHDAHAMSTSCRA